MRESIHTVIELWQVITRKSDGRQSAHQIILFDSVDFATEDFSTLRYLHDQVKKTGYYINLALLADPDNPRDLFGMVQRVKGAV